METDHDKSRVVWGNVVHHIGTDNATWLQLLEIAEQAVLSSPDPLAHAWKFAVLAEFAPSAQWVDMIYASAMASGTESPDLEEIVERRLTREFSS